MKITTVISDNTPDGSSSGEVRNIIDSVDAATSPAVSHNEMIITEDFKKSWILDETTGPAFDQNIYSLLGVTEEDDVKCIHIQCRQVNLGEGSKYKPIFFNFALGAADLNNMSQFTMCNLGGFEQNILTVSNVQVPAGEKAILEVFIGINQD